jgi:hypothetical protein
MTYPFSSGEILTATNLNLVAVPDTSTTWTTPIFSGVTVGNGTTGAKFVHAGALVHCFIIFTLGSSSAITGPIVLLLPFASTPSTELAFGSGNFVDLSAGTRYAATVVVTGSTAAEIKAHNAAATYATTVATSAAIPMTWASGDWFAASFTYLAA